MQSPEKAGNKRERISGKDLVKLYQHNRSQWAFVKRKTIQKSFDLLYQSSGTTYRSGNIQWK